MLILTNSNPQSIDICCVYIKSGISCRFRSRVHFPRIQLVVSLLSGIHQICIPAFPFVPPTQSDTCYIIAWNVVLSTALLGYMTIFIRVFDCLLIINDITIYMYYFGRCSASLLSRLEGRLWPLQPSPAAVYNRLEPTIFFVQCIVLYAVRKILAYIISHYIV